MDCNSLNGLTVRNYTASAHSARTTHQLCSYVDIVFESNRYFNGMAQLYNACHGMRAGH